MKRFIIIVTLFVVTVGVSISQNSNHIRKISFQGILKNNDGTIKANNTYSITFALFKEATGGTAVFSESASVTTLNGFFTHEIGSINPLQDSLFYSQVYLQIQVSGDPNPITPRVTITPSPYSFYAHRAYEAERVIGGGGGGWGLSGNIVTATDFLGTTNNQPLIAKVNNTTRLVLANNGSISTSGILNKVGIGAVNLQYTDNITIDSLVAEGKYSVALGIGNRSSDDNSLSIGDGNRSYGVGSLTFGSLNTATNEGSIAIGSENISGSLNVEGITAGIAIGSGNESRKGSVTIGNNNLSDQDMGIALGVSNTIRTSTTFSGISVALGAYNTVSGEGSFAIGDGLVITGPNSYGFGSGVTNSTYSSSFIIGGPFLAPQSFTPTANDADGQMVMRFEGGYKFYTNSYPNNSQPTGVELAANGYAWQTMSDRNSKENFKTIDFQNVLRKLEILPVTQWNYKTSAPSVIHWGPMAQDFKYYFGLGTHADSLKITTLEMDGVLMAGVKGLIERTKSTNEKIQSLEHTIEALEAKLAKIQSENSSLKVENSNYELRLQQLESTVKNVLNILENPKTPVRTVTSKK